MGVASSAPPAEKWHDSQPPTSPKGNISLRATLGAGCYWGTEKFVKYDWGKKTKAVKETAVGFMGPPNAVANPTYRLVCTGTTKQVEVLDMTMQVPPGKNGEEIYESLIRFFFQFHDPTTMNRQGNDVGTQYASVIFVHDDRQREIALKVKSELQDLISAGKITCFFGDTVSTAIVSATEFYSAHEAHQDYLHKNRGGYCNHGIRFSKWPKL